MVSRTIRQYIDMRAEKEPNKIYMLAPEPNLTLTYAQLKRDSIELGKYLYSRNLRKGDKISFMLNNGFQTTKIFLGAMYAGLVITPLNLMSQSSQLQYVIEHSDTQLIFFSADYKERLEKATAVIGSPIELIQIDNDAQQLFPADTILNEITLPDIWEEDNALLLYTSGTTGFPKGVVLSHKNIVTGGQNTSLAHRLTSDDRVLCSLPLYHINGEVVTTVAPLVCGSSVVMPHKFSVTNFWEIISKYQCTWFSVVPTIISYLFSASEIEGKALKLKQLRFGRSASSALPPSLHKAFEEKFKIYIIETMGLTETAATVFSNPIEPSQRKYGSPGQEVGCLAKIIDGDGKKVPPGTVGEIMIKGDNVMKYYYKSPNKTAEALESDGWLHTGDLGYMDKDRFVFVVGRIKELIIKGGENIAPCEIDEVFYKHPAIQEAAAVGIPDEEFGEEIMVCCVLYPDWDCTEADLREYCRNELNEFKIPKMIKIVKKLPKGPSGKIQRLKLRDMVNGSNENGGKANV